MVPGRQFFPLVLSAVRGASGGSFCHEVQQEDPDIHLSMPGPKSSGLGFAREIDQLEPVEVYIPISSLAGSRQSDWLAERLQRGRIFDSPFLANSELVPSFVDEMSNQVPITKKHVLYQRFSDQVFFHNNLFLLNLHVWKL